MRIGLFTDSYHPSTNGIVVVVDTLRKNLEALGHEVYVVAPAGSLRWWKFKERHVIRFAGIKGLFFDEFLTSVFFPPKQLRRIGKLNLDAIVFFTPAQIGLMGAYSAITHNIPLVAKYSTDLTEYVERYPAVMPGVIALYTSLPFALRSSPKDVLKVTKQLALKSDEAMSWKSYSIQTTLTYLHNRCDAVVSVSPKITKLLKSWGTKTPIQTIPDGVDKGKVDPRRVEQLKTRFKLGGSKVLLSLGRVAKEKNIDLIIDSLPFVLEYEPSAKLMIVGDFSYRSELEQKVKNMGLQDSVIFTGKVAFNDRWNYFALADVFCFPSMTDTQALVVNEAGLMGLPIVWCDEGVNEILVDNQTGIRAENRPSAYAKALITLLGDKKLRHKFGAKAKIKASRYSELSQTKKVVALLQALSKNH